MNTLLYIGQWQGFFKYGAGYGAVVKGQEAEFRLFIEEYEDGKFSGRIIDWEGLGANGEVAVVNGFINEKDISFTKQYDQFHTIDEWGNQSIEESLPGHQVVYEGHFDEKSNSFTGQWEIATDLGHTTELSFEEVMAGTWRMHRNS